MAAALWARRLGIPFELLEAESRPGGQLRYIQNEIGDVPGLVSMDSSRLTAGLIQQVQAGQLAIHTNQKVASLHLDQGLLQTAAQSWHASYFLLATGASMRRLQIPGEKEMIARGEQYSTSRGAERFRGKEVVVVGGGDRAFEGAWRLAEAGARVTLVHRSKQFRARTQLRRWIVQHPGIRILTEMQVKRILGESRVEGVEIEDAHGGRCFLRAEAVFTRIGIQPNSELVAGKVDLDEDGYVIVDRWGRTSHPRLYAAGDVCTPASHASLAASFGQAVMAVKSILLQLEAGCQ